MCGIAAIFNIKSDVSALRPKALAMSKIRHRGPDWSGIYCGKSAILAHERLSIVDPESGGQPLFSPTASRFLQSTARFTTTATSASATKANTTLPQGLTAR